MIDPITGVALGVQAGTGIYQMYKGAQQAKQAEAMRQDYQIPQEIYDTMTAAEIQAAEGMPAAQKAEFIQNLQGSTQSGINALQDRSSAASGVEGVLRNEQNSFMNLASQDSAVKQANQANLQAVRQNMAGYVDKQFQTNVTDPVNALNASATAMKGAGMQNVAGVLGSGASMSQDNQMLQDILGNNNVAPPGNTTPGGGVNNIPLHLIGADVSQSAQGLYQSPPVNNPYTSTQFNQGVQQPYMAAQNNNTPTGSTFNKNYNVFTGKFE